MRASPLLFILLILPLACGEGAPSGQTPSTRGDLTRVGTLGWAATDLPGPSVTVSVDPDGGCTLNGKGIASEDLVAALAKIAPLRKEEENGRASAYLMVLRCDPAAPWSATVRVVLAGADPSVGIYRQVFAVLPEVGDEEGTLAWFLPKDRGFPRGMRPDPRPETGVLILADGEAKTIFPRLRALAEAVDPLIVNITPNATVSTGTVLSTLDIVLRAGADSVLIRHSPSPPMDASAGAFLVMDQPVPDPIGRVVLPPIERTEGITGATRTIPYTFSGIPRDEQPK